MKKLVKNSVRTMVELYDGGSNDCCNNNGNNNGNGSNNGNGYY